MWKACAGMLYEVIYNLLDNGVKYNRPGGTVKLTLDTDQGQARIRVEDTGRRYSRGRPEPGVRTLLPGGQEPFQGLRRHGIGTFHREARRAVFAHGGSVEVSSALGKGTCFTVRIPEKA